MISCRLVRICRIILIFIVLVSLKVFLVMIVMLSCFGLYGWVCNILLCVRVLLFFFFLKLEGFGM